MVCNLAAMAVLLAAFTLAQAQATRTWVSGVGDDANPCSRTAPCKTFAGAISKTAPCGEIDVLDPGGFGALTITKSIKIEADGLIAGVLVSGTNAFVVAAQPTDHVVIRGLTFEGLCGSGLAGIKVTGAAAVHVENCYIDGFSVAGIDFAPNNTQSQLFVENTTIRNCVGGGVRVRPNGVPGFAELNKVRMQANLFGFRADDNSTSIVRDSVAAGNTNNGFLAFSAGAATNLTLENCTTAQNGVFAASAAGSAGIQVNGANAVVNMSNVMISGNAAGLNEVAGGQVRSWGNNHTRDSGAPNGAGQTTQ
jgi:hypothetical protein